MEVEIKEKRCFGGSYSKYEVCSICGKKLKESSWHQFETCCWVTICTATIIVGIFIGIGKVNSESDFNENSIEKTK